MLLFSSKKVKQKRKIITCGQPENEVVIANKHIVLIIECEFSQSQWIHLLFF